MLLSFKYGIEIFLYQAMCFKNGFGGLIGKCTDFLCNNGESFSEISGMCCFNCCIE